MTEARTLLRWFRVTARNLPWRSEPRDPYLTLVSEIMLQQTQVDRVVPRFENFVSRFPNFSSLAAATEEEVLAQWSGLGYYRRARMLHRLATRVCGDLGGVLPSDTQGLRSLPGVGEYTAAAVASLVFGRKAAVLDGNTIRVSSRVLASDLDPGTVAGRSPLKVWIDGLIGNGSAGEVNEALMELGATVCTRSRPACGDCPLRPSCAAAKGSTVERYPISRRGRGTERVRWVAACVVSPDGRWLLRRIGEGPILRGLWLPPFAELKDGEDVVEVAEKLAPFADLGPGNAFRMVRHSITYRRIEVLPVRFVAGCSPPPAASWQWARPGEGDMATSTLLKKLQRATTTVGSNPSGVE